MVDVCLMTGQTLLQDDTDFNGISDVVRTYKSKLIQQVDIKPNGSKFTTTARIFKNVR